MSHFLRVAAAVAVALPCLAHAQSPADVQALKDEIARMRAEYEARIQALEARLAPAAPAAALPASVAVPSAPAAPGAPGAGAVSGIGFNPAVSLVLSGLYGRTSRDPQGYRIRGLPLPPDAEIGPGTRGFSLAETELGLSASVDPWFRGAVNLAFAPDNSLGVEEAYVESTSLGHGLTARAGRFLSGVGYLNAQHAHTWDFVDAPLAYQALLGTQFANDGVQLSWLAPTDRYFELRGELGRGGSYPGNAAGGNGAGAAALAAHTGGDIGESQSWRAGLSVLHTRAAGQSLAAVDRSGADVVNGFSGSTRTWIADFVWKWAPDGNATRTNFKLQGEYLRSTRDGALTYDVAGAASTDGYRAQQSGWYLQGVYQFMPRWRIGLRTERLGGGAPAYGANAGALAFDEGTARKHSLMLDWSPSEFSRVRLQLARDRSRPGASDNQFWLQYQMSLGAHGAHSF